MGGETKYGWIRGGKSSYPLPMGALEYIRGKSGRFVKPDDSPTTRRGEIAGDTHGRLMGFVEGGDQRCSATEGATVLNCIDDVTAVFRLPLAYDDDTYTVNYSDVLIGTKHDLVVANRIQYANLTDASEKTIIVVGGKAASAQAPNIDHADRVDDTVYGDGYVDVRLTPSTLHIA